VTEAFVHPTAEVESGALLGEETFVWNWTHIRQQARVGARCRIGQGVFIDEGVTLGDDCKVQNGVSIYAGVTLGDRVFVGPAATFTNDRVPRAVGDWEVVPTWVADDVSIGANATIVCGVKLHAACMVGAGAVVTRDVPRHSLVLGNPAEVVDYVDLGGRRLHWDKDEPPPPEVLERSR
jgi:acetyltransferase-like isoleucine patch superfamily enzyme